MKTHEEILVERLSQTTAIGKDMPLSPPDTASMRNPLHLQIPETPKPMKTKVPTSTIKRIKPTKEMAKLQSNPKLAAPSQTIKRKAPATMAAIRSEAGTGLDIPLLKPGQLQGSAVRSEASTGLNVPLLTPGQQSVLKSPSRIPLKIIKQEPRSARLPSTASDITTPSSLLSPLPIRIIKPEPQYTPPISTASVTTTPSSLFSPLPARIIKKEPQSTQSTDHLLFIRKTQDTPMTHSPTTAVIITPTTTTTTTSLSKASQLIIPLSPSVSPIRPIPHQTPTYRRLDSDDDRSSDDTLIADVTAGGMMNTSSAIKVEEFEVRGEFRQASLRWEGNGN